MRPADEFALAITLCQGRAAAALRAADPPLCRSARDRRAGGAARGPIAHQHRVAAHLRRVAPLARKYRGRGRGRRDLLPEGHLGRRRAADKFD